MNTESVTDYLSVLPADQASYVPPSIMSLGLVVAVTAGPIADGGNIDALVGMTGGFNATSDHTS